MKYSIDTQQSLMEAFQATCQAEGVPFTIQRKTVLEVLMDREDHPTADQVYDDVIKKIPTVSKATVYRTLEMLARIKVIQRASHLGSTTRYDSNTQQHHHLICLKCDKILDYPIEKINLINYPKEAQGFEIVNYSIYFSGYCLDCKKNITFH
jgi:Fur family peroxide stress response transcriptional regulator